MLGQRSVVLEMTEHVSTEMEDTYEDVNDAVLRFVRTDATRFGCPQMRTEAQPVGSCTG